MLHPRFYSKLLETLNRFLSSFSLKQRIKNFFENFYLQYYKNLEVVKLFLVSKTEFAILFLVH